MTNPEQHKPLKELDPQLFDRYLNGDYPQNGPYYILERLMNTSSENEFFNTVKPDYIWTVEEYVKKKLEPRYSLTLPSTVAIHLEARINIINTLVNELKTAVESHTDLRKIYYILLRFNSEAGIPIDRIEKFEEE